VPENAMLPIWVISLEESVDRRSEVSQQLSHINLPFRFYPAIDGRGLSPAELRTVYAPERAQRAIGRPMTPGEIGCSLSHLSVYRSMVEADFDGLVVLEDDARPRPGLRIALERTDQWPRDWEVMFLYHLGNDANHISLRGQIPLGLQHRVVRFSDRPLGTVAYAVRLSAARKLLSAGFPVSVPADELLNGYAIPVDLCRYGIHPAVIEHKHSNDSFLAAERALANASTSMATWDPRRFLPKGVYRRGRRLAKFGKRFFRRFII
jgi:glycosyl transferase, family 25